MRIARGQAADGIAAAAGRGAGGHIEGAAVGTAADADRDGAGSEHSYEVTQAPELREGELTCEVKQAHECRVGECNCFPDRLGISFGGVTLQRQSMTLQRQRWQTMTCNTAAVLPHWQLLQKRATTTAAKCAASNCNDDRSKCAASKADRRLFEASKRTTLPRRYVDEKERIQGDCRFFCWFV